MDVLFVLLRTSTCSSSEMSPTLFVPLSLYDIVQFFGEDVPDLQYASPLCLSCNDQSERQCRVVVILI